MSTNHNSFNDIDFECLARAVLVERIMRFDHPDARRMAEFAAFQAPASVAVIGAFSPKSLTEGVAEDEAAAEEKAHNLERTIGPAAGMSLSILAGGRLVSGLAKAGVGGIGLTAGSIAGGMAISFGAALLVKYLSLLYLKRISPCYKSCKSNTTMNRSRKHTALCTTECQRKARIEILTKLKAELPNCKNTGNPLRCEAAIHSQISKNQIEIDADDDKIAAQRLAVREWEVDHNG